MDISLQCPKKKHCTPVNYHITEDEKCISKHAAAKGQELGTCRGVPGNGGAFTTALKPQLERAPKKNGEKKPKKRHEIHDG